MIPPAAANLPARPRGSNIRRAKLERRRRRWFPLLLVASLPFFLLGRQTGTAAAASVALAAMVLAVEMARPLFPSPRKDRWVAGALIAAAMAGPALIIASDSVRLGVDAGLMLESEGDTEAFPYIMAIWSAAWLGCVALILKMRGPRIVARISPRLLILTFPLIVVAILGDGFRVLRGEADGNASSTAVLAAAVLAVLGFLWTVLTLASWKFVLFPAPQYTPAPRANIAAPPTFTPFNGQP